MYILEKETCVMAKSKHYTISMDPAIMDRIDSMSKVKGGNRSAFIAHACTQYIEALERMPEYKKMLSEFTDGLQALQQMELP